MCADKLAVGAVFGTEAIVAGAGAAVGANLIPQSQVTLGKFLQATFSGNNPFAPETYGLSRNQTAQPANVRAEFSQQSNLNQLSANARAQDLRAAAAWNNAPNQTEPRPTGTISQSVTSNDVFQQAHAAQVAASTGITSNPLTGDPSGQGSYWSGNRALISGNPQPQIQPYPRFDPSLPSSYEQPPSGSAVALYARADKVNATLLEQKTARASAAADAAANRIPDLLLREAELKSRDARSNVNWAQGKVNAILSNSGALDDLPAALAQLTKAQEIELQANINERQVRQAEFNRQSARVVIPNNVFSSSGRPSGQSIEQLENTNAVGFTSDFARDAAVAGQNEADFESKYQNAGTQSPNIAPVNDFTRPPVAGNPGLAKANHDMYQDTRLRGLSNTDADDIELVVGNQRSRWLGSGLGVRSQFAGRTQRASQPQNHLDSIQNSIDEYNSQNRIWAASQSARNAIAGGWDYANQQFQNYERDNANNAITVSQTYQYGPSYNSQIDAPWDISFENRGDLHPDSSTLVIPKPVDSQPTNPNNPSEPVSDPVPQKAPVSNGWANPVGIKPPIPLVGGPRLDSLLNKPFCWQNKSAFGAYYGSSNDWKENLDNLTMTYT